MKRLNRWPAFQLEGVRLDPLRMDFGSGLHAENAVHDFDEGWQKMAIAAMEKGFPEQDIYSATQGSGYSWSGSMVHRFAVELRPTVLDDLGLIPALHTFMKDFMKRTGVRARLTAYAAVNQLPFDQSAVLYRVALEALNNVAIHAQASAVEVHIKKLPDWICLTITDDGKSFDVKRVLRTKGNGRLGLLGMRERLQMIGGKFSVKSTPGHGTTVTARIPVTTESKEKAVKGSSETKP